MCKKETNYTTMQTAVKRIYKDTVFRMLFKEKEKLLELYNAVNKSSYADPEALEIVTLENAVYMGVKNDLAFVIDFQLHLYEHQSTVNPNMPIRFLQYVSKEYEKLTVKEDIYGGRQIMIPAPRFVVFYNGIRPMPDESFLHLSDAFLTSEECPWLELKVRVLNINIGRNQELLEQCRTLAEYAQYVARVRKYAKAYPINRAVDCAVEECIREGILTDFLKANRAEVKSMSIFEYDDEATKKAIAANSFEDGLKQGREEGMKAGFNQGTVQGRMEGILFAVKNLQTSLHLTAEQAMEALSIPEEERVFYVEQLGIKE